jgi:hypothetical protein
MTHTKDEALRMALEALVYASSYCDTYDAIDAIKQALAVPVQEPVAWVEYETGNHTKRPQNCGTNYCSCIECVMEPAPVQEPVAWAMYQRGRLQSFWLDKGDSA